MQPLEKKAYYVKNVKILFAVCSYVKKYIFCDLHYRYLDAKSSQTREQQKNIITDAMLERNQRLSPTVQPMQRAGVKTF